MGALGVRSAFGSSSLSSLVLEEVLVLEAVIKLGIDVSRWYSHTI